LESIFLQALRQAFQSSVPLALMASHRHREFEGRLKRPISAGPQNQTKRALTKQLDLVRPQTIPFSKGLANQFPGQEA
jgi:hypothetical protein